MILRALHVAAHRAAAVLRAKRELRLSHREPVAARRADLNDAVRRARPVQRRARRALHDFDALDIERVEIGRRLRQNHAVHDDERRRALVDARRRSELNADAVARLRRTHHRHAGDLALNRLDRVRRRNRNVFLRHAPDGERHLRARGRIDDARDDRLLQMQRGGFDREVDRRELTGRDDHASLVEPASSRVVALRSCTSLAERRAIVYRPLSVVSAPSVVPVIAMLIPDTGAPADASVTVPPIRPVWARATTAQSRKESAITTFVAAHRAENTMFIRTNLRRISPVGPSRPEGLANDASTRDMGCECGANICRRRSSRKRTTPVYRERAVPANPNGTHVMRWPVHSATPASRCTQSPDHVNDSTFLRRHERKLAARARRRTAAPASPRAI